MASAAYNPEKRGVSGQQNNDRTSPYRPEAFAEWVCVTKRASAEKLEEANKLCTLSRELGQRAVYAEN